MATVTIASNKKVLIIEDMQEVRKNLQMALSSIGFQRLHGASNVKAALELMSINDYEIILCDYNLGDSGPNGQQLLEYLRTENKLDKASLFIMITAENSYKRIVSATEYQPDDYMLKPFTAAMFMQRLERLVEAQNIMIEVNSAFQLKDWEKVVARADKIIEAKNRHYFEALKLKAHSLMALDRLEEAEQIYLAVNNLRELPWSLLGLAKIKAKNGFTNESIKISNKIMQDNPHFLQAFDFYAELMINLGKKDEAERALAKAVETCPGRLSRARALSVVSMQKGDYEGAEKLMHTVMNDQKHSLVKSAMDYTTLAKSMTSQSKTDEAMRILDDAKKKFTGKSNEALLSVARAAVYLRDGDLEKSADEMKQALSLDLSQTSSEEALFLAESFFAAGHNSEAEHLVQDMVNKHPNDMRVSAMVKASFSAMSKPIDNIQGLLTIAPKNEPIAEFELDTALDFDMNRYQHSFETIIEANKAKPNNIELMSHGAFLIATAIINKGAGKEYMDQCLTYRRDLQRLSPHHPKLETIDRLINKIRLI